MAAPFTVDQQLVLVAAAERWAQAVRFLRAPRDAAKDEVDPQSPAMIHVDIVDWERHRAGVHVAVLAMEHLATCLKLLRSSWPGELARAEADRFLRAWKGTSQLRDVLEHEEEYLLGRGKEQAQRVNDARRGTILLRGVRVPMYAIHETPDSGGRLTGMSVLGVTYDLTAPLDAAEALVAPLLAYLWPEVLEERSTTT